MNEKPKRHYRAVFKSDHLAIADIEDMIEQKKTLDVTIKMVDQHWGAKVAGKKIDCNIAYFEENIKPMVLNATNCLVISKICESGHVENWTNVKVTLFIDYDATLAGRKVGGVRIKPTKAKTKQTLSNERFSASIDAIQNSKYSKKELGELFELNPTQKDIFKEFELILHDNDALKKHYDYMLKKKFTKEDFLKEFTPTEQQLKFLGEL